MLTVIKNQLQKKIHSRIYNYIILTKIKNIRRGYSFYSGYLLCRELIVFASNKYFGNILDKNTKLLDFLPTEKVYGIHNISDSYKISKINFDFNNQCKNNIPKIVLNLIIVSKI